MNHFFYGVIEGFYGRQWSWHDRAHYADFLAQHGFDCYIYAPKGDRYLRARWREQHPASDIEQLMALGKRYRKAGVRWGIGLSPLGLSACYTASDREQLQHKVAALNALAPDILCILFDDTRGDIDELALRQLEITRDILAVSHAQRHIVCPTYYSFDPVLEEVFGAMPQDYLATLGSGLSSNVDIFWTGNQVISHCYTHDDLAKVTRLLKRRPVLWDNYPVNDGKQTSQYLHVKPYNGRPHQLAQWSAGHIVNPMNQPGLSQLVLYSLQKVYELNGQYNVEQVFSQALERFVDAGLALRIKEDCEWFQHRGLAMLSQAKRDAMIARYACFNDPVAKEIVQWLAGGYRFDPLCLTG